MIKLINPCKKLLLLTLALLLFLPLFSGVTAQITPPAVTPPARLSINLQLAPPATPAPLPTGTPAPAPPAEYDLIVTIQVSGINLVSKFGQEAAAGEGHIVYYFDNEPQTFPGSSALTLEGVSYATTAIPFRWTGVEAGYHHVAAQLVNNDETPFNPPVFAEIRTNLEPPGGNAPALTSMRLQTSPASSPPASPSPGVSYFDTIINLQVSGVTLVNKTAPPNVEGEAHLIQYWLLDPPTAPNKSAYVAEGFTFSGVATTFTWLNERQGYTSYAVQLVGNDQFPLDPPIYAMIKANMRSGLAPSPSPSPAGTVTPIPSVSPAANSSNVTVIAQNNFFNPRTITVSAGSQVTVTLINLDTGVPHSFSIYQNIPGANPVFVGAPVTGPEIGTYSFTAPPRGTYTFECDIHPTTMNGQFIVQ